MNNSVISMRLASETIAMFVDQKAALEDRKLFVHNLGELLKQTREPVVGCELDDEEVVTITFRGGGKHCVNINCDSYAAIIRDVAKNL